MEWRSTNSPGQKKIRLQKSGLKTMLIVFDIRGIIHKECIPQGTTVDSHCYLGVMQRLHERMRRVTRDVFDTGSWQLAAAVRQRPSHCALNVKHLLAKKAITTIEHPPNLPDLAPADYFLFPRIKRALKEQRFDVINAIQEGVTRRLQGINSGQYQRCFQDLINRSTRCVQSCGDYFENIQSFPDLGVVIYLIYEFCLVI
jgi:hypothetical protein